MLSPCHSHWGLNVSLNELHFNLFLLSAWPGPNWMPGTPLKGMHNSSAGRPRRPFIMGQGSRRERRRREERKGRRVSRSSEEGEQVGSGEGRKGTQHSCSHQPFSLCFRATSSRKSLQASGPSSLAVHCTGQTSVTLD